MASTGGGTRQLLSIGCPRLDATVSIHVPWRQARPSNLFHLCHPTCSRSGWASKPAQEGVLAITLRRPFFERLLGLAVPSSAGQACRAASVVLQVGSKSAVVKRLPAAWRSAPGCNGKKSAFAVGLLAIQSDCPSPCLLIPPSSHCQWDPDHYPDGSKHERRAIQVGRHQACYFAWPAIHAARSSPLLGDSLQVCRLVRCPSLAPSCCSWRCGAPSKTSSSVGGQC